MKLASLLVFWLMVRRLLPQAEFRAKRIKIVLLPAT